MIPITSNQLFAENMLNHFHKLWGGFSSAHVVVLVTGSLFSDSCCVQRSYEFQIEAQMKCIRAQHILSHTQWQAELKSELGLKTRTSPPDIHCVQKVGWTLQTNFISHSGSVSMNFRPEMRKVTHVLPREGTGKAAGPAYAPMGVPPMVPPKAHPMRPGCAGFTPAAHPVSHATHPTHASHASSSTTRIPGATAGFKHDPRGRRTSGTEVPKVPAAPGAPVAPAASEQSAEQPAASPRQGSKEMPKPRATPETKASDRQVVTRKKWEAVRERALTLLAAPAASPRNTREDGPKRRRQGRGSERPKGGGTDAEAVRDRALTLLASSNSDRIKERTKTFIQKHHVDISLEPDELPGIPTDDCDTKPAEPDPQDDLDPTLDAPAAPAAAAAPEAPEPMPSIERESDLPEASPEGATFSEKPPVSKKTSSPGKSSAPSPFAPPPGTPFETRDPVEETQLAQLSAGIFWILGCFFQCLLLGFKRCRWWMLEVFQELVL